LKTLPLTDEQRAKVEAVVRRGAAIATLATPEELHYAARAWNWDNGVATMREIVERSDCALATAMLVFWRSLPDEIIGTFETRKAAQREGEGEAFDLQIAILERASTYERHDIAYDPSDDDGTDWLADYPKDARELPLSLTQATPGRHADPRIFF
jgi:hypothetical protein